MMMTVITIQILGVILGVTLNNIDSSRSTMDVLLDDTNSSGCNT